MTRYRIDLAYDGTDFHGWAVQDGLRTVQGTLQEWITRVLRLDAPAELTVAGRTDAGVHARGQVAHVDLAPGVAEELQRRLDRVLPPDVVVRRVAEAPDGFDARFAAVWRRYVFRLSDAAGDPLTRATRVRVRGPLDVAALDAAARRLVGLHDFAAFCKRREGATTIREILEAHAERDEEGTVAVTLRADAFCHSMVRSVVGALVAVGQGRHDPAWIDDLLARPERAGDVTVMPPYGLVLEEVGYPADADLAARQLQARARRDSEEQP
ncbi:tRNA pseudouridine(38-40) synthase TruA [Propioniciclava coleopterorum]|uniref:tRNA pseudouridine synthase A n=1 Tax=Propioniciclava coleopterorum TaxID=2714937 RepID=A0A6G7Y411_9ACTN|nr:tRNA pseudouridine(38-40) synthase TruA [Propioniciclava coleopterorum]QIK71406.1 tRNA pseudouridine(38-40) synthase TruA [Propioniciclava coleopterorum]